MTLDETLVETNEVLLGLHGVNHLVTSIAMTRKSYEVVMIYFAESILL